jgi:hypothetical protein
MESEPYNQHSSDNETDQTDNQGLPSSHGDKVEGTHGDRSANDKTS